MKKGFTAIELLVTLGIIVLISLVSIPFLVSYQRTTKLRSESRLLATNLRLAQQLAITEQKLYQLKILPLTKEYQVINAQTSEITKEVSLDQDISISQTGFTDNIIQFIATGAVLETGNITLENTKGQQSIIQVKPSGYVDIND